MLYKNKYYFTYRLLHCHFFTSTVYWSWPHLKMPIVVANTWEHVKCKISIHKCPNWQIWRTNYNSTAPIIKMHVPMKLKHSAFSHLTLPSSPPNHIKLSKLLTTDTAHGLMTPCRNDNRQIGPCAQPDDISSTPDEVIFADNGFKFPHTTNTSWHSSDVRTGPGKVNI